MQANKYLQHIIRKNSNKNNVHEALEDIESKKEEDLKTYLLLVQKRLQIQ
jgi:hypothetical protein